MSKKTSVAIAIAIVAAVVAADAGAATTNDAIRVGTCNVRVATKKDAAAGNGWNDRKGDLIAFLRKLDMDVFGLQEVHAKPYRELCDGLKEWELVDDHGVSTPVAYRKSRFDLEKKGVFWLSETKDPGPVNTYHGWGRVKPIERMRVDYIYVSDGIRVRDFTTHGDKRPGKDLYPTDHYPLSATIELPLDRGGML